MGEQIMPRYIIKLPCDGQDYFMEWSSVVDAPVTYGMTWDEFQEYYRREHGEEGMRGLPERMKRVHQSGTSDAVVRDSVQKWVKYNRAGENEKQLTYEEILDAYVRKRPKD